ncbi:MAG: ATP-binding cassette domain-containing protein [Erysipelotrichales bacterium]|nr:ATP-binding cassette domain-containing protein [Erysipelotrichales bacterium]
MLKLKNIYKYYEMPSQTIKAVNGVNLEFRKNEFVSILGPSGCGKTTMLNIIGGLDKYTSGDLIIEGISTREYKDKEWDNYRNKRVGFVFQSYNLIPHLSILGNVELALTISGISAKERKERAKEALIQVGLEIHINKKPNQLSGGQMQRVAIARALVNRPEILLADEPTGALDTTTSEQIMELIRKIAQDKLVIMVTHNPELAKAYSSRIVQMRDGIVIEDSNPYNSLIVVEEKQENPVHRKNEKSSMSFVTALQLSSRNLLTKKRRSIMMSIACAIGILGIGLVLSLTTGLNSYINELTRNQVETSPIQISSTTITQANGSIGQSLENFPAAQNVFVDRTLLPRERTRVPADLRAHFAEEFDASWYNYILYRTGMQVNLFNQRFDGNFDMLTLGDGGLISMFTGMGAVQQLLCPTLTLRYYEELAGRLPIYSNEVVLIVNEQNALTDMTLMGLGLINFGDNRTEFSFDEILGREFILPNNDALYNPVIVNGEIVRFDRNVIESPGRSTLLAPIVNNALTNDDATAITISGIIRLKEGNDFGLYATGLAFPSATAEMLQTQNANSDIIEWMITNPFYDPFTGDRFIDSSQTGFGGTTITRAEEHWEDLFRSLGGVPVTGITVAGIEMAANEIAIYATSLAAKDQINAVLDAYNEGLAPYQQIFFIDIIEEIGAIMSDMINMISIVLIGFTSISLVVSAVMISIITSISVLERTKEIGILRSIGARKKDVTRLFNAENVILGLLAGSIGILVTLFLSFIINLILVALLGTSIASVTWWSIIILLAISTGVAFVSGFLPSRAAAKKDPVLALRSE